MAHIQVWTEPRRLGRRKQYRWRIVASNGRIICTSGEGYNNLGDMWHAVNEVAKALNVAAANTIPVHQRKPSARLVKPLP